MKHRIFAVTLCAFVLCACGDKTSSSNNKNSKNNTDACANVSNPCDAAGLSCDSGDVFVACAEDDNGCLVEERIDCAAQNKVCDSLLGCVDESMGCSDDTACTGQSDGDAFCNADVLVDCTTGADGCLHATETDCANTAEVCLTTGGAGTAECTCPPDPECAGASDGDSFCSDQSAVSCAEDVNGCLIATVEDCAASGLACDDSGTPTVPASCTCYDDIECSGQTDGDTICSADMTSEILCSDTDADGCLNATPTACGAGVMCAGGMCGGTVMCGDGLVDGTEACDDMNTATGDGCDDNCMVEPNFTCDTAQPSVCTPVNLCGNGMLDGAEACDDMNTNTGDGCDDTCMVEVNFSCDTSEPSVCTPTNLCGNGVLDGTEECDDNNTTPGDGCNGSCMVEFSYVCDATGCTPPTDLGAVMRETDLTPVAGDLSATGDDDWYSFSVSPPQTVVLDCNATGPDSVDTEIYLYDGAGALLDDSTAATGAYFSDDLLQPGTYYVQVEAFGGPVPAYTLDCTFDPVDLGSFAVNDTATQGSVDVLTDDGDRDWYSFTLSDPAGVNITTTPANVADDFDIFLLDDASNLAIPCDFAGSSSCSPVLNAGQYYIQIGNHDPMSAPMGLYDLNIVTFASTPFDIGTFAAGDTIPNPSGGALVAGGTSYLDITFTNDVLLDIALGGWTMGDADLIILDATGHRVAASETAGPESLTGVALSAGTYRIVILTRADLDMHGLTISTTMP